VIEKRNESDSSGMGEAVSARQAVVCVSAIAAKAAQISVF
jgi:hypothetical protein